MWFSGLVGVSCSSRLSPVTTPEQMLPRSKKVTDPNRQTDACVLVYRSANTLLDRSDLYRYRYVIHRDFDGLRFPSIPRGMQHSRPLHGHNG